MAMTQAEEMERLEALGCAVTPRGLGLWRRRGLLLPLQDEGRGRGRGKVYSVSDPRELDRAVTVYRLMRRHSRIEPTLVALFLAGFEVEPELLREAWLSRIGNIEDQLSQMDRRHGGDRENSLHRLAVAHAQRIAPLSPTIGRIERVAAIHETLNLIWNPAFNFEVESAYSLFTIVCKGIMDGSRWPSNVQQFFRENELLTSAEFLKAALSLNGIRKLIAGTSALDFQRAQNQWRILGQVAKRMFSGNYAAPDATGQLGFERMAAIGWGGNAIVPLIYLTRFDQNRTVERCINMLDEFSQQPTFREMFPATSVPAIAAPLEPIPAAQKFWADVTSIWAQFDFPTICQQIIEFQAQPVLQPK